MELKTERVFRSGETPQLKLATRNVPAVKVRVYKIDIETYFRKMHSIAGIERLDVSLIDPDTTLEFAVPGYVQYKPLTRSIPVPLPDGSKAGVAAVSVSSPTLESTTLLIQSDLEILVKSSRDEVLVFAENVATGKPWPGVRLLISDGRSVFAEAKTGDDGFFRQRYNELHDAAYLRVFAAAGGGHVASTAVRLDGEPVAHRLADRIYVDTDRSSYFAGETVHVQGAARHADGDRFSIEPGKKLTVDVLDNADRRLLRRRDVTLSAMGTFAWDFLLPAEIPEGTYKVVVLDRAGHRQNVDFQIGRPQEDRLRLVLDLPRSVYYRGEVIEGSLRAVLPEDRPLAGVKVMYKLGDAPATSLTTDARGEVHFAIPTAELESYGPMGFEAAIPSRSLSLRREVTVATRGFSISLETTRPVFVAGEAFDVRVATLDAADRPRSEKLLLRVYRRDHVGETTREELIAEYPLVTAADGTARRTLRLAKGGAYVVRATGTDRFGNRIASGLKLAVSGDDDPQRLLLLVDRTQLKAGETVEARIYWRGQPARAVVTCHFDRLIQNRQIAIETGLNRLQIPVTAAMAPGFTLTVSVMADCQRTHHTPPDGSHHAEGADMVPGGECNRLHEAACALRVDPDLQVKIECHRHGSPVAAPLPGEPADVTVTTCDAQGKPVAAEVSLDIMPLERGFGGPLANESLATFFRDHDAPARFQTASSIQFHYQPANRVIGALEPEEDAPAVPAHIASQQGIPVAKPAAADNPPADFAALKTLNETTASGKPAEDDPFGSDEPVAPARNAGPAALHRKNQRFEHESTVWRIPRPTWSGYWNPAITTGPDGRATISLTLPDDAKSLTVVAKAITSDKLSGQASQTLVLKKDLSATIHLPPAFTDGDEAELPVVVQNQVLDQGTLEVALNVNVDGIQWNEKKTLDVKSRGRLETSFKTTIRQVQRPAQEGGCLPLQPHAVFTVTAKAGGQSDICRQSVPILPYGEPCRVTTSGLARGEATVTIAPSRRHWATPTLQIVVSPSIQRSLLDLLEPRADSGDTRLSSAHPTDRLNNIGETPARNDPADTIAGTEGLPAAGDLMAALALAKLYPADSTEGRMLDERIRTTLSLLIATQQDGAWSIDGRQSTVATNALAYWSLVLADKAGFDVPHEILNAALRRLRGSAGNDQESDLETKAIVLHCLAIGGQGDFALANHLLRDRKLLSPSGRAYLALALVQMGRKESAADVLRQPDIKDKEATDRQGNIEAQALTALALLSLDPTSPQANVLIEAILSQRTGLRWNPDRVTGPAVLAATTWLAKERAAAGPCRLEIAVNVKPVKTLDLDPNGPTQMVDVPLSMFVKGQQRIELRTSDSVRLPYRCTFSGVDPAEFVQGTSAAWSIRRNYEPGPIEVDEEAIPRGFGVLSGEAFRGEFSNRMTQLPAARRGSVELRIDCYRDLRGSDEKLLSPTGSGVWGTTAADQELLVVEPLPSGAKVVPSSLQGCFDRAEILPGEILFFLSRGDVGGSIRYDLEAVFPSSNLISPTILRRVGRDAPLAIAKPKSLVVLPQGARSTDPYRLSPDELLSLGAIAKRKSDVAAATRYYTELLDFWHGQLGFGLSDAAYKQTIFSLMELGMGRAAPARLVQYCEVIKEKWPGEPVTLDQLLTAAGAYREIGEFERSYMACRAAVEGSFTRESGLAGFLDTRGEFLRSVSQMNRLLRDYPPEPYLAEAEMELAQRVYAKGSETPPSLPLQPQPHQPGLDREALIGRACQKLEAFLTGYPTDPAADQAAFAAANAQLDLKRYADAAQAVTAYARRYPQSELLDSYWYILAYCDFASGKHASAIDMCRKVAQAQHLDKESGRMVDSPNKYRALYILGQVYQSLGQRADAIREYRRVESRIPDAKSSVDYFLRKQISLPDCTTLKPGTAAEVELSFRNIAACDVKVYRVDLMKFCEAGQALGDLSQVNLAGIRPLHEVSATLRDGKDYCDHTQKLTLPLKKEGAYLIVCRGEDLYTSGLLLISPLEIESRFDPPAGQIRVFVKDTISGKYLSDVQIKLMPRSGTGVANVTGVTDLRGVFVGNCPAAAATIVAQAGNGSYAYFATSPSANDTRGAIASTGPQQDDPTIPFASGEPQVSQSAAVNERPTAALPRHALAPAAPFPERSLPPPRHDSPTMLSRGTDEAAVRRIREALKSPTHIEFVETPLKDVIDYLKDLHHIEIQLDSAAIKEAGVDESTPVTKNLQGISLRSALKMLLDELQLKLVVHNEVLLITSPAKAESDEYMEARTYPVEDLVIPDRDGGVNLQPLEDLLTTTVATKTWADNGGTGSVSTIIVGNRPLLVVSQTQEVHAEIENVLEFIRKASGLRTTALHVSADEAAERRIREALNSPTQIEFVETPLKDVIDYVRKLHHIEIQLDSAALKESGIDESASVTKNLKGISLRSALKLLLDELQLKYVIHNGVLLITSPTKAESDDYMQTRAYPVTDLVVSEGNGSVNVLPLEDLLTTTVATKTWVDNGGTGAISHIVVGNRVFLVLSQSQEVHEQLESTLETLRRAGGLKTDAPHVGDADHFYGEPPAPAHPRAIHIRQPAPQTQGLRGGMGGMGAGAGARGAGNHSPDVTSVMPVQSQTTPGGDADLLEGLKNSNAANQKAKVLHLKQRQDAGQGGAGGMGGGMGGGMF
ncbi:MAG: MG2 domain-containing protein [Thermoguttaceae bacterium]